ncbi:MAG: HEPN domain-containing protein [Gemmataceae bacterium]|nr:HEPN domain-containing protein [Gemmataceae bacterium]
MQPATSHDFQKAAAQRLTTAEVLLRNKLTLDAMYGAGYTVKCSLKALILEKTLPAERPALLRKITSGAKMHGPEVLVGILRDMGILMPLKRVKKFRKATWTTELRYETGRKDTGETRAFLKTAKDTYQWVEEQLP